MKFSDQEKAFSVEIYLRTGSFKESMYQFKKHFKVKKSPSRQRIAEWTAKFRGVGSVQDQNRGRSLKSTRKTKVHFHDEFWNKYKNRRFFLNVVVAFRMDFFQQNLYHSSDIN